ncbi:MAG: hypothetical protein ACKO2N_04860, partial [Tabrizicola sp.]
RRAFCFAAPALHCAHPPPICPDHGTGCDMDGEDEQAREGASLRTGAFRSVSGRMTVYHGNHRVDRGTTYSFGMSSWGPSVGGTSSAIRIPAAA